MKRLKINLGSEWPYEWHEYYKCINVFQIYYHNDGGSKGVTLFLFNYWACLKIEHKP